MRTNISPESLEAAVLPGALPGGYRLTGILDAVAECAPTSPSTSLSTTTFEGIAPGNQSRIVVRFFPFGLSRDPVRMQALRGSLQATARLRHPNIVPIVGSGLVAGRPYIVMPFVPAGSLKDRFALGAVSGLDAARSIGELAAALEYVHSRGMVHGCLQPSKVLFDESGTVQVTGFGEVISDRVHSPNGSNGAVHLYDAPEVTAGGPASRAADQYAFAVISLEMLTGRPAEEARQVLKATADGGKFDRSARPIRARFNLAPAVAAVLSQGLEADPAQRFPSVGAMNRALRVALGVEAPTQPVAKSRPAIQPVRRPARRVRLSLLAPAMALALCLLIVVPFAFAGRYGSTQPGAAGAPPTLSAAPVEGTVPNDPLSSPADTPQSLQDGNLPGSVELASEAPPAAPVSDEGMSQVEPTPTPAEVAGSPPGQTSETSTDKDPVSTPPVSPPPPSPPTEAPTNDVNPKACKDDPDHPNYCPPTPVP